MAERQERPAEGGRGISPALAGVLSALVIAPAMCAPYSSFGFEPEKMRAVLLLVSAGIGLSLLQPGGSSLKGSLRALRTLPRPALAGLGALLLVAILSPLWSLLPAWSLWGSPHRAQGAVFALALAGAFLAILGTDPMEEHVVRRAVVLASLTPALAVFWWWAGWPLPAPLGGEPFAGRAFGTLGNPNYLGSFLLFSLPITLWELAASRRERRPFLSVVLAGLALLQVGALVLCGARGAWVGLTFAGLVALVMYTASRPQRGLFPIALGLLLAASLAVILMLWTAALPSLSPILDPTGSGRLRLTFWDELLHLYRSGAIPPGRILFGYGLDAQGALLPNRMRYRGADVQTDPLIPLLLDRAHNLPADVILTAGLAGLAALLLAAIGMWGAFLSERAPGRPWRALSFGGAAGFLGALALSLALGRTDALPPALGIGFLAGTTAGGGIFLRQTHSAPKCDEALLWLSLLAGHWADMQFGFETTVPALLAAVIGALLLKKHRALPQTCPESLPAPGHSDHGLVLAMGALMVALSPLLFPPAGTEGAPFAAGIWLCGGLLCLAWRGPAVLKAFPALSLGPALVVAVIAGFAPVGAGMDALLHAGLTTFAFVGLLIPFSRHVPRRVEPLLRLRRMGGGLLLVAGLGAANWLAIGDIATAQGRRAVQRGDFAGAERLLGAATHVSPFSGLAWNALAERWVLDARLSLMPADAIASYARAAQAMGRAWEAEPFIVEWGRRLALILCEGAEIQSSSAERGEWLRRAREVLARAQRLAPANAEIERAVLDMERLLSSEEGE